VTASNYLKVGSSSSQVYPELLRIRHMCEVIAEHRHVLVKFLAVSTIIHQIAYYIKKEMEVLGEALRCGGDAQDIDSDDEEQQASSEFVNNLLAGINKLFAVKAAITIGICDTIARAGPGAFLSIHEIAKGIGSTKTIHIQNLRRLMKALLVFGFFSTTYGEPADPLPNCFDF
jgi:hypothetical protein